MTQDTTRPVAVEEGDREAAADWFYRSPESPMRHGGEDDHPLVQAFARHRLAERERAAAIATNAVTYVVGEQRDLCNRIAAVIREPNDE